MIGVWMEDESTVTTVSQGISRPNGANTALNFLTGVKSGRTVGKEADGRERVVFGCAGTTGKRGRRG